MKNLFVLAVAGLVATSANAAEMKWSGGADWRYSQTKNDTGLGGNTAESRTKAHELRANIGATGGWENMEWGVGVRTQSRTTTANDDFSTLANNVDLGIGVEQAWFRYLRDFGSMDLSVTAGRQKNVLAYDAVSQNLFDNDVRWDGLGWQFKFGMFGLNAAQYVLGARQGSATQNANSTVTNTNATQDAAALNQKFNYLFAFQPHMNWKFTDEIEAMFAVGYYMWRDTGGTNAIGNAPVAANFRLENLRQWHFLTGWTLPYNLSFNAEYVMANKQKFDARSVGLATPNPEASRTAWAAGLTYGGLKKARDFTVGYAYGTKGIASVDNRYTYEKFAADRKGHIINVGYAIADNFNIGWKGVFVKEKEKIDPATGVAYTGSRGLKTSYWELTTGVMF